MKPQTLKLFQQINKAADKKVQAWWENYVKESAPFVGVRMPRIREIVGRWHKETIAGRFTKDEEFDLALQLFDGEMTEFKLAGILYLSDILLPLCAIRIPSSIGDFAKLFDDGKIYDWNVCDWFCIKVLNPLIEKHGMKCAKPISSWSKAHNMWRTRASLVAFALNAGTQQYHPMIQESCKQLIRRKERFAKTSVGWILREISKCDPEYATAFVDSHLPDFTPEVLRNALKYQSKERCKRYISQLGRMSKAF